ncbi:hypothetical protein BE221DRAFT_63655 [Ostreococcus tauri]|uniref:Secreted protein n=1 Tax=Ostreococcus tauri TaxID=70448 RepID=A0A1Y5I421_OSTTA|nr:hypothetical protein BE221DRAFT_63655 [Ostreococcus tauri]
MYLQLFIATHVLAASSARYPRTHVACCENLPKFVQGKTRWRNATPSNTSVYFLYYT